MLEMENAFITSGQIIRVIIKIDPKRRYFYIPLNEDINIDGICSFWDVVSTAWHYSKTGQEG